PQQAAPPATPGALPVASADAFLVSQLADLGTRSAAVAPPLALTVRVPALPPVLSVVVSSPGGNAGNGTRTNVFVPPQGLKEKSTTDLLDRGFETTEEDVFGTLAEHGQTPAAMPGAAADAPTALPPWRATTAVYFENEHASARAAEQDDS